MWTRKIYAVAITDDKMRGLAKFVELMEQVLHNAGVAKRRHL